MIMLLTLQFDILSQSLARDSTLLASSFLMPQRGKILLNRINYNDGGEVHKFFTTSNANAMLMEGNQPCKMVFETYSLIIN